MVTIETCSVSTPRRMLRILLLLTLAVGTVGYDYNYGYSSYNNGYNSNSGYGNNNAYNNRYGGQSYDTSVEFTACDDSVVKVTYLTIECNSPYTFYYGNGANRDSPTCDYGDKATIAGTIDVVDDLQNGDDVYVTMAAYDDDDNHIATIEPTNLCDTYIGSDCTVAGTYSFSARMKFEQPDGGNQTQFIPSVQMAFSTKADSGYNLGAVNMECLEWDQNNPSYVDWSDKSPNRSRIQVFLANNILLFGTCISLVAFSVFIWRQARREDDTSFIGGSSSKEVDLMELS